MNVDKRKSFNVWTLTDSNTEDTGGILGEHF